MWVANLPAWSMTPRAVFFDMTQMYLSRTINNGALTPKQCSWGHPPVHSCLFAHIEVTLPWSQKKQRLLWWPCHTYQAGLYRVAQHVSTWSEHCLLCAGAAPSQCSAPSARPSQSPSASSAPSAKLQFAAAEVHPSTEPCCHSLHLFSETCMLLSG